MIDIHEGDTFPFHRIQEPVLEPVLTTEREGDEEIRFIHVLFIYRVGGQVIHHLKGFLIGSHMLGPMGVQEGVLLEPLDRLLPASRPFLDLKITIGTPHPALSAR